MKFNIKLAILIVSIFSMGSLCYADTLPLNNDSNITGHVIDAQTKEHLPYIDIIIDGTTIGTNTDATGHFFLKNLPLGKFTLTATSIGYKSKSVEVVIKKNSTLEVNFELEADLILLEGSVISANMSATNRSETPNIVNVITPKIFAKTNSVCLSD